MSDTLIHDLAVELAHACHDDDAESTFNRVTLTQAELPFLKDGEYVTVEYRRKKYGPASKAVLNEYETVVVGVPV